MCDRKEQETYGDQEDRKSSSDDHHEDDREDLVRVLGGLAEDVVDLRLLAVAHCGRGSGCGLVGVLLELNVEGVGDEALSGAKRADHDGRVDGLEGCEQLGGDILLGLYNNGSSVSAIW